MASSLTSGETHPLLSIAGGHLDLDDAAARPGRSRGANLPIQNGRRLLGPHGQGCHPSSKVPHPVEAICFLKTPEPETLNPALLLETKT